MTTQETLPNQTERSPSRDAFWRDAAIVLVLMLFTAGLRWHQIRQTVVTSRDSIAFLHYVWLLDHHPWDEVFARGTRHPGYPVAVWAMAHVVPRDASLSESAWLQQTAQVTNALASVLLVLPLFALGKSWFGHRVAIGAVLMFQCLPDGGLTLADGLSEGVFLLFAVTALWAATRGVASGSPWFLAICGLASGLAYLTRPEGVLIAAMTGVMLLARQVRASSRVPLARFLAAGTALTVCTLAMCLPLMIVTGGLTCKPTGLVLLKGEVDWHLVRFQTPSHYQIRILQQLKNEYKKESPEEDLAPVADGKNAGQAGLLGTLLKIIRCVHEGTFYFLWVFAILGLLWMKARGLFSPGFGVFLLVTGGTIGLLMWVSHQLGYASERHLLVPIVGLTVIGAYGMQQLTNLLTPRFQNGYWLQILAACLVALGSSLSPLHKERAGFRDAGEWLAANMQAGDVVVDPHQWAAFHAGCSFDPPTTKLFSDARTVYFVLEERDSHRSNVASVKLAQTLAERGQEVFRPREMERKGKPVKIVVRALQIGPKCAPVNSRHAADRRSADQ